MMNVNFKPGFTIINYTYDNPSSGGQSTVKPGEEGVSYLDPNTGRIYMYTDGYEGTGWYYISDDGLVYDPNVDPDDLIPQGG